jgi:hypothetical protein
VVVVSVCGSLACGSTPPKPPPPAPAPAITTRPARSPADEERARKEELAAAHRVLEEEQSVALAATCEPGAPAVERACAASCYATEPADPRAGKKLAGKVELRELVCVAPGGDPRTGPFLVGTEVAPGKAAVVPAKGRFPAAHKKRTWQADVVAAIGATRRPKVARGDVLRIDGGWRDHTHPVTKERLRCVTLSHFAKRLRRPLDACGADGSIGCEATGNAAARGLNVVHYRVAEARALEAAGKPGECKAAAREAIAFARGLPRWRQYMKLNVATWTDHVAYRTRFDGTIDEDTLFATAARLGTDAEALYAACGGTDGAPTKVTEEQAFHTCW